MNSKSYSALAVVLLVLVAGCAGGTGGLSADPTPTNSEAPSADDSQSDSTGTINFYVSDEKNAIEDFEHLNVTITKVGFHLVDSENDTDDEESVEMTTTVSDSETTAAAQANNTTTADEAEEDDVSEEADDNESDAADDDESEAGAEEEADEADDDGEGDGEWVERDVDNVTVDLTQYQGANATLLDQFDVPNGSYNKVFVYIGDINATLNATGDQVNVKLPSERLHINSKFTVGNNESVDFVFDITIFKAGNSGKYILKPVVSESGTDVAIEADEESEDDGADDEEADEANELQAAIPGPVTAGESATLEVTSAGSPVEGASVSVNGNDVGTTDANGTITFTVPSDADELEIEVTKDDREAELEREIPDTPAEDEQTTTAAAP